MKLFNDDCLKVLPTIPDKSIDLILTDPPYGTTACKWDSVIPFEPMWKELKRIIKDNSAIVFTASQPFTSSLVMSNVKMLNMNGYGKKQLEVILLTLKYQPMKEHENILVFRKVHINIIRSKKKEKVLVQKE
jgi:site-specific DNA-methyltransferase (adenine-specific)